MMEKRRDDREKLTDLIASYMEFVRTATPKEMAGHLIYNGVVAREKGEWISHEGYEECRNCHAKAMFPHNFCPNCGADMRKEG